MDSHHIQRVVVDGAVKGEGNVEIGVPKPYPVSYRSIVPKEKEKRSKVRTPGHKPRRWVVERTLAWLCKCRGILVRYDKKDENYLGLIQLACALFWYRRLHRLGRCDTKQGRQNTS